jgi:hypothetical protein
MNNGETTKHILKFCPFPAKIWDLVALFFHTTDRNREILVGTLTLWRSNAFTNPIVNRVWILLPCFLFGKSQKNEAFAFSETLLRTQM